MIDIKNSQLLLADRKLNHFTEKQALLWDIFFKNGNADKPVNKSDLMGKNLDEFRSNLWSGRFIYDENGEAYDMEMNQVGEELANYYGQRNGQCLINDYEDNSFRTDFPTYYYQFKNIMEEMLKKKMPLLSISHYQDKELSNKDVNVSGLMLPVSSDGKKIDMILGYSELSVS